MPDVNKVCSVVVCVYQNEPSIPALCDFLLGVQAALGARHVDLEVVFADDGSTDGSFQVLERQLPRFNRARIVKLTRNFGAVRAFNAGLSEVRGDCLVCMSADLQDDPNLILVMVDAWLEGARFVIGERRERQDPLMSRLAASTYYWVTRTFMFAEFPRGGYDVFLLDAQFFPVLRAGERNSNAQVLSWWIGLEPTVIPYTRQARPHGKSRWTMTKKAKHFVDTLVAFSFAPLRLVSLIGLFVSLVSFAWGIHVVIASLMANIPVPGWSSLMAGLSFFFGIVVLMLAIIGEYVWRILDQVRPRADFVIDRVVSETAAAANADAPALAVPVPRDRDLAPTAGARR